MFKPVTPLVDFPALERDLLKFWNEAGVVKKYLAKNKNSKKKFSFLDGPITANNPMGVHHAWGRTYKDLWQRFWNMRGYQQRFQNGFDEQGLWVEVEVEKELGLKNKKDIENLVPGDKFKSLEKFISLCKERVKKYAAIQTEQSKRLGYFMDWDNSYHTSSDENNFWIWNFLKNVHEKGWLYKGRDSVPWCPRCGTAISQHEILTEEYKEITHRTVVFKLPIKNRDREYLLAWTTTPWTIPGNVALAVDPNLTYWKMEDDGGEKIIILNPLGKKGIDSKEMLLNKEDLPAGFKKIEELKGKELVGLEYTAPYDNLPAVSTALAGYAHRVLATDSLILPIDPLEGTGIVHVATGAGSEDFRIGKKENLPVIEEINDAGIFIDGFGFLTGEHVKKASKLILEDLKGRGLVFKDFDYLHRYPTCWRCKEELVWRVVDEWYIGMDKKDKSGKTFREQMIEVAKKITWMPEWGLERELDWLTNMHDWLISKKRYWGLALPIWECQKCGNFDVIGSQEELKKQAAEGYEEFKGHSPHRPWIDKVKIKCSSCRTISTRISDVGNPWLDAGIVPFSTMPKDWYPADFITESFPGQFKNWFYALIAESTALKNANPFKRVLGFGSVRDEKGEEMHKSKGNAIEFNEAADKAGVDVMRWLYIRTNPEHNVNFGYSVLEELRRLFILKLWNVYSFFVTYANLYKWKPPKHKLFRPDKTLDKWILSRMSGNITNITRSLENYLADEAMGHVEIFVTDLSNWYVRRIRDRIRDQDESADEALHTLWTVLENYSRALAPFIPFLSEEIYSNIVQIKKGDSVHLKDWPIPNLKYHDPELEKQMEKGIELASVIHMRRKVDAVSVRIPIKKLIYKGPPIKKEIEEIVKEETNVDSLVFEGEAEKYFLKGELTEDNLDLRKGAAREIVRKIQEERKRLGTRLDEKVNVSLEDWPKEFEEYIKGKALIKKLTKGDFSVSKNGQNIS
jgi:isoleucyl-tRNA synthetase